MKPTTLLCALIALACAPLARAEVPEGISASDWQSIRAAYEAGQHAFSPSETGWTARNPGQRWTTTFDERGFLAIPDEGDWTWGLELLSYGTGEDRIPVSGTPSVAAEGQRLSYRWDGNLEEWWINDRRGLEQGWTLLQRPEGKASETLRLDLVVRGKLEPRLSGVGDAICFLDPNGTEVLTYGGLRAWDSRNHALAADFEVRENGIHILVDDRNATYPITIDPLAETVYLKASNPGIADNFGTSVAISGNTVVVGALGEDSSATTVNGDQSNNDAINSGAAYVFVHDGSNWTQQAYLKASNCEAGDAFGCSVSISGDLIAVGAFQEDGGANGVNGNQGDNNAEYAGAVYVFARNGSTWAQEAYLKASNPDPWDYFGHRVSIDNGTLLVAAPREESNSSGVNGNQNNNFAPQSGAVYVFVRSGATWSQQAYLKASNPEWKDWFGVSISISGDTAVVGALWEDSSSTGINSDGINNNAEDAGAAYVFVRNGTTWSQQAYLKASNTDAGDQFGFSVAASGNLVIVGANLEDGGAAGIDGDETDNSATWAGAAYLYRRNGTAWSQEAYLKASNAEAWDNFGSSVAIHGDRIAVGARGESGSSSGFNGDQSNNDAPGSGAVYLYVWSGSRWSQQSYIKASNTGNGDQFGFDTALSDDILVVSTPLEAGGSAGVNGDQSNNDLSGAGAAYIAGLPASVPDLSVRGNGVEIIAGSTTPLVADHTDFGTATFPGGTVTRTFALANGGSADLTLVGMDPVAITGSSAFSVATQPTSPVPADGETTFVVAFTPGASGLHSATVSIASDDPDHPTYSFAIQGLGGQSRISVSGPGNFGRLKVRKKGRPKTFTIRNTGTADLIDLATALSGKHRRDFRVTAPIRRTLEPGTATTFRATFRPLARKLRKAVIEVRSSAANGSPIRTGVSGRGM